uniref:Leucine-rich repeat flightless-interacting protein 2-like n=1 Tax=Poecilia latipinna TaxID=48699 RepID=A0A3B3U1W6_9TELE
MGTQGPGRKRIPNRDKLAAEEDALSQIAREAEARLAAKRAARAEAREIRMKELERQQKEAVLSASLSLALPQGSRTASTLSAATLASLGGASSRRGSCDTSFSVETEASIREMKDSLAEAEEKYRRAMVSNAQLHNDKTALMFQVENLMEELSDMEELLWEARRRWDDATKLERERQAHSVLKVQFKQTEETLRQTNELLTVRHTLWSGLVKALTCSLTFTRLFLLENHPLFLNEISSVEKKGSKVRLLQSQLDQRNGVDGVQNPGQNPQENGIDPHLLDLQRDANRQISELKFKLVKSEQEVTTLEQNVSLHVSIGSFPLCSSSRQTQRRLKMKCPLRLVFCADRFWLKTYGSFQLRSALDRIEELEVSNSHLSKRLEKMKANRNALLAQQ